MTYRNVFDVVWSGRRHIMMMASQIDPDGNQNISCHRAPTTTPRRSWWASRGAPVPSVNHRTSYWVPDHTARNRSSSRSTWSGRWLRPRGRGIGRHPVPRRAAGRVATWACSTSTRRIAAMRLRSYHPGVSVDDIVAATGFDAHRAATTSPDAPAEPRGARHSSASCSTRLPARPRGAELSAEGAARAPALTPGLRALGDPLPARADRHGLGRRAAAHRRHVRGGRSRHPGLGHDDLRPARAAIAEVRQPDHRPIRGQPAHRRGRRDRPDRFDDRNRRHASPASPRRRTRRLSLAARKPASS